ncbi:NAD(P)H-hydrate epimerase [Allomyces arbusculus]|nr:NAD(P)H-hydrate epimerase [Allomyces arbusculus]
MNKLVTYLGQKAAQAIDVELMSAQGGFSIDQLMELAGLSVAQAVERAFPLGSAPTAPGELPKNARVLVCCGPGNNGGDGLLGTLHLRHFGYAPMIFYPKKSRKPLFAGLTTQLSNLDIPFVGEPLAPLLDDALQSSDLIVDALFGFSFSGDVRAPFDQVIQKINDAKKPIVSVDVPSGWDVEQGPIDGKLKIESPAVLVSLTAPKLGCLKFDGTHFVGGRFIPPSLAARFGLTLPVYERSDQIARL